MNQDEHRLDQCRDLVSGLFDTQLSDQDEENLLPSYYSLLGSQQRYGPRYLLGKGALKSVYRCWDSAAKRDIAWATPKDELGRAYYDTFVHEAWLTASLRHPNIIKIHEVGVDREGKPYFTMDLKAGKQLNNVASTLSLHDKLNLFNAVCGAVSYAHAQGVLHLDLKPENIQCDQYGEVLVCDWGLGKLIHEDGDQLSQDALILLDSCEQTIYGDIKGTPGYMAPEQVQPGGHKDVRTDVYALGGILYFLLSGQRPIKIAQQDEIKPKTLAGISSLDEIAYAPKALLKIISTALAVAPEARYQSVTALKSDVKAFLEQRVIQSESQNLLRVISLFCARHARVVWTIVLSLSIISGLTLWNQHKEQQLHAQAQQITEAKISLSKEYEELSDEYDYFEQAMVQSRQELIDRIAGMALKRFRQFQRIVPYDSTDNPVALLHEVDLLATKGYESGIQAHVKPLLLHSNAIQLNFQRILANAWEVPHNKFKLYYQYARMFPDYNFGVENRPTLPQLVDFFEQVAHHGNLDHELLQGILYFDISTRDSLQDYAPVIVAYLKAINPNARIEYHATSKTLAIDSIKELDHHLAYAHTSVLTSLHLSTLKIKGKSMHLSHINGAHIQSLDLSQINQIIWGPQMNINNLETIILPRSFSKEDIQLLQNSNLSEYEVVQR